MIDTLERLIKAAYLCKTVLAVVAALLIGTTLVFLAGGNPVEAYAALFTGGFLDYYGIANTLVKMSPILLTSLALIIPLRAGLFNVGGEGQVYVGALCGTVAALYLPHGIPVWVALPVTILAGAVGGALWALIPAVLNAYRGINEVVTSLLLSYVAVLLVSSVIQIYLLAPAAPFPYSEEIRPELRFGIVLPGTEFHYGVLIAILLALAVAVMFAKTKAGKDLELVGHSRRVAAYAGIDVNRIILSSFALGGSMAGLAGTFEVLGLKHRLYDHFSPGYGFQGIIVAFLARLDPALAIVAALFMGGLQAGAGNMQRATGIDTTMVGALQGLIVLFVAVGLAFKYRPEKWARFLRSRLPSGKTGDV